MSIYAQTENETQAKLAMSVFERKAQENPQLYKKGAYMAERMTDITQSEFDYGMMDSMLESAYNNGLSEVMGALFITYEAQFDENGEHGQSRAPQDFQFDTLLSRSLQNAQAKVNGKASMLMRNIQGSLKQGNPQKIQYIGHRFQSIRTRNSSTEKGFDKLWKRIKVKRTKKPAYLKDALKNQFTFTPPPAAKELHQEDLKKDRNY